MTTKNRTSQLRANRTLWVILGVALLLRVAAALYLGNTVSGLSGAHDEISYSMLGRRFAAGFGMTFPEHWYPWIKANAPQSYYSYTISLFLGLIYGLFGYVPLIARLIMALLSTASVYLLYLIAERLFDRRVATTAAAIAAVYAYLIFYGVTLVTETPFILALLAAIYCALRLVERPAMWWWVGLGLALALSLLLRMAVVFFVPVLLLWLFLQIRQPRQRAMLLIPIALMVAAVVPLSLRNYRMWDHFLLLESQFGHVFWNGNHPDQRGNFDPERVFAIPDEVLALDNDALMTSRLLRLGVSNVLADPGHFLNLTGDRLKEFFTFWPTADSTRQANLLRVVSFGVLAPLAIVGLVLSLPRWRALLPIYAFLIIHTAIYATSWTMIRYRIPLDIFFILFAGYTVVWAYDALRRQPVILSPDGQSVIE